MFSQVSVSYSVLGGEVSGQVPLSRHLPWADRLWAEPLPHPRHSHCSGRYASYWNAFLSRYKITTKWFPVFDINYDLSLKFLGLRFPHLYQYKTKSKFKPCITNIKWHSCRDESFLQSQDGSFYFTCHVAFWNYEHQLFKIERTA